MMLGKKINFYRKQKGISQENLAEIMGVSRQSVSLWENNQTTPSMDKLIQLTEVLEISMDELLDRKTGKFDSSIEPLASARSDFSKSLIDETSKMTLKRFKNSNLLLAIICAWLIVIFIFDDVSQNDPYIFLPIVALVAFCVRYFRYVNKYISDAYKLVELEPDKVFKYEFYSDYVDVLVSSSKSESRNKIRYEDFEKVLETKNYYLLIYFNKYYSVDKRNLKGDELYLNSLLKSKMKKFESPVEKIDNTKVTLSFKKASILKVTSNIIFVLSFFTLPIALLVFALITLTQDSYSSWEAFEKTWVFLFVLPLPISCIVLGRAMNKYGLKGKKNIILGGIMSVLVVIYSLFSLVALFTTDHDYQYLDDIESIVLFEFPDTGEITTMIQNASSNGQTLKSESDVLFIDEEEILIFEQNIQASEKWTDGFSTHNLGMISTAASFTMNQYDYYMVYNVDLQTYNQLPSVSGTYDIIFVLYNETDNTLKIHEYSITITTD